MHIAIVSPFDPWPAGLSARRARAAANGAADGQDGLHQDAHVGGVEKVLGEVAARLAARGHQITLVCSTDAPSDAPTQGPTRGPPGVEVIRVPSSGTVFRAPRWHPAGHIPPADVVHVPATYPMTTGPVLMQAKRQGTPAVLDFHFEPVPPGPIGRAAAAAYRGLGTRIYGSAAAVAVRSLSYARNAPSLARIPERRLRIVPNGVDLERFTPDGPRAPDDAADGLLFVGRLVPYKGVEVLLRALSRMPSPPPLVLAGDGPLRPALQDMARRLGVDARFLGHVPDDMLPALYRSARLTVLPSVNRQEAFGIVLIESMASGTPVVASALPGVKDVALTGGMVAPPGDVDALAAQLQRALSSLTLPRGVKLAHATGVRYSWDHVVAAFEQVYEDVVSGGAEPGQPADAAVGHGRAHRVASGARAEAR